MRWLIGESNTARESRARGNRSELQSRNYRDSCSSSCIWNRVDHSSPCIAGAGAPRRAQPFKQPGQQSFRFISWTLF